MIDALYSLIAFAAASTLSPGGATTLATASGAQHGYRRSLPLILGMAFGLACLTGASATGLATVIQTWPILQLTMQLAGSTYLLLLALRIGMAGPPASASDEASAPISFFGGMLLLVVNPKAWAMAFGAAASFSGVAETPIAVAAIMAAVFGLSGSTALTLWCLGGSYLARIIRTPGQWRALNVTLGLFLTASIIPIWL